MKKKLILLFVLFLFLPKICFAEIGSSSNSNNKAQVILEFLNSLFSFSSSNSNSSSSSSMNKNVFSGSVTDINQLLSPDNSENISSMTGYIADCLKNRSVYEEASRNTGLPWQVFAGIHYREGSCDPNSSLVSGRTIGSAEPDMEGNCSSSISDGLAIPVDGGCGFSTLTQSAIYAGRHLIDKIGRVPSSFEELSAALFRYNGGGNSNCGQTNYSYCPPSFEGDDDPYPMSLLDDKHKEMYIIYCEDGVANSAGCPRLDTNLGAMTAISVVSFASK